MDHNTLAPSCLTAADLQEYVGTIALTSPCPASEKSLGPEYPGHQTTEAGRNGVCRTLTLRSMTSSDQLGKYDLFIDLVVMRFHLVKEAVRHCMTLKAFECRLFEQLLITGIQVVDQFLIAQGDGNLRQATADPDDTIHGQSATPRKLYRSPETKN
jgi:hypothetical protein